jgi:hypothetical protein
MQNIRVTGHRSRGIQFHGWWKGEEQRVRMKVRRGLTTKVISITFLIKEFG